MAWRQLRGPCRERLEMRRVRRQLEERQEAVRQLRVQCQERERPAFQPPEQAQQDLSQQPDLWEQLDFARQREHPEVVAAVVVDFDRAQ